MIKPALQNEAFLADVAQLLSSEEEYRLWWLGQSGFLLKWADGHAPIDPYLSNSLTEKYATTDKPHVRLSEIVIKPSRLDFIDVVTSSHNHTDHLDPDTLKPVLATNPHATLVVPTANRSFVLERLGASKECVEDLSAGEYTFVDRRLEMIGVPAAHEAREFDAEGHDRFMGYIFWIRGGPFVYHSGDTVLFNGMIEQLRPYQVDVALLPINGRSPERRVAGNLNGKEAAWLAKEIGAKLVIPCHYDMFEFNTATPDEFVAECQHLRQPYRVLKLGERWSSTELK